MPRVAAPPRAALAFKLEKVRLHRLARDVKESLLEVAIDSWHQCVRRRLPSAQCRQDLLLALAPVFEVPAQYAVRIPDDRPMGRKQT